MLEMISALKSEIVLIVCALLCLVTGMMYKKNSFPFFLAIFALIACVLIFSFELFSVSALDGSAYGSYRLLIEDQLSKLSGLMISILSLICLFMMGSDVSIFRLYENIVIFLLCVLGTIVSCASSDLMLLYIGMEMTSMSFYAMLMISGTRISSESAVKYFITSAVASGVMLFGSSIVYGFTGTTDFDAISEALSGTMNIICNSNMIWIGYAMIIASLLVKLGIAPFHFWIADVYQGSPLSVLAFFSTVPKIATISIISRLLTVPFDFFNDKMLTVLTALSVFSILFGSVIALVQRNIKRFLAYSSVSHHGYVLLAIVISLNDGGVTAALLYSFLYSLSMIIICIFLMRTLGTRDISSMVISDLSSYNFFKNYPISSICMVIALISGGSIPPTGGFMAKFMIITSMMKEYVSLVPLVILSSLLSVGYYMNFVRRICIVDKDKHILSLANETIDFTTITMFLVALAMIFIVFFYDYAIKAFSVVFWG